MIAATPVMLPWYLFAPEGEVGKVLKLMAACFVPFWTALPLQRRIWVGEPMWVETENIVLPYRAFQRAANVEVTVTFTAQHSNTRSVMSLCSDEKGRVIGPVPPVLLGKWLECTQDWGNNRFQVEIAR